MKKFAGDIIILHMCTKNHNHMMYGSSDTEWNILGHLLPFNPPMDPENQNFQKNRKKTWRYYYFTNINDSHMMYGSLDIESNRQNFLSFGTIFCPFTPLRTQKIKIFKNWRNAWRYHHFIQVYQKLWSHAILFLRYGT